MRYVYLLTQDQLAAEREREREQRTARHEDLDLQSMTDGALSTSDTHRLQSTLRVKCDESDVQEPQTELETLLRSMQIRSHERVAQKRIYSMLYHPALDKDLVFTGDQEGVLGVWDCLAPVAQDETEKEGDETTMPAGSSFALRMHARSAIGCLRMDPGSFDRLYSSSHDASIRVFSLSAGVSSEVWVAPDDIQLSEFDIVAPQIHAAAATATPAPQLDERSLWVADHRGGLVHVDIRTDAPVVRRWQVCDKKVRAQADQIGGLSVNPAAPHCLATASNDRSIRLFDVRMLKTVAETPDAPAKLSSDELDAVEALQSHVQLDSVNKRMACTSIDFSPNGHHLAGLSYDDTLSIWNVHPAWLSSTESIPESKAVRPSKAKTTRTSTSTSTNLTERMPPSNDAKLPPRPANLFSEAHVQSHNNQTGKWVTLFRAVWNRNEQLEPHFSVGSMTRHAEVYGQDGRLMASLYDPDWVTAIPAVTAMHPLRPARLATGNGSGRCVLWAAEST